MATEKTRIFQPRFDDEQASEMEPANMDTNEAAAASNTKIMTYDYDSYSNNSPCASNDSGSNNNIAALTPCAYTVPQTTFLSCIASSPNELMFEYDASATTFEYDYEIHTPISDNEEDGVSLMEAVDEFQNGLAGSLAAQFGVYCAHDGRHRQRALGKDYYEETDDESIGGGGMYAPVCLGVSSSPSDVPDDFITQCIIDVNLTQESTCTPMKGYLTLYSRTNRRKLSSTLQTIQTYIEDRKSTYVSENILAVSYIGQRSSVGVGIINPSYLSRPKFGGGRRSLSVGDGVATVEEKEVGYNYGRMAAVGVSSCCLAVVALMFLVFKRRRHASNDKRVDVVETESSSRLVI